jgi:hypothetical protein
MKYTYIISLLLASSSLAYAADGPTLNDRESLRFIFGRSFNEVNTALTDSDFNIHIKGLEYTLSTAGDQSDVAWTSPNPDLTGKVVMLSTKEADNTVCKNFMETLKIKDKAYEGNAIVCFKAGQWVITK